MSDQVKTRLVLLILVSLFLIAASPSVRKIPLRSQREQADSNKRSEECNFIESLEDMNHCVGRNR